jgi:hypothetical protein
MSPIGLQGEDTVQSPIGEPGITRFDGESPERRRRTWGKADLPLNMPIIVCLCGSTRFSTAFQEAGLAETLAGRIVLTIGAALKSDAEHFGHLPEVELQALKLALDTLHLHKIQLADEVLILNVKQDGVPYIGPSTMRELAYAVYCGKTIRFLNAVPPDFLITVPKFETLPAPIG